MSENETRSREFKGIWIPADLWLDTQLTAVQKVIYAEVDSFCSKGRSCFFSNEYLSTFCNISIPTITRLIRDMIEKGYLKQEGFDGRKRYLKIAKQPHQIDEPNQNDEADQSKCYKQPDHFDEHNNTYTNTTNKVSKDTYRDSENTESNIKFKKSIFVERWNKISPLKKVKDNPSSKTYQKIHRYCSYLINGTFGNHCQIEIDWAEANRVPLHFEARKFTQEEVFTGLERLTLFFQEGYWPEDKSRLKKMTVDSLIYNPMTHSSFLLKAMATEPKPIKQTKSLAPEEEGRYRIFLRDKIHTPLDEGRITLQVNDLKKRYESIKHIIALNETIHSGCADYFGTFSKFVGEHLKFLADYYSKHVGITSITKSWYPFLDRIKNNFHFDFDPDKHQLAKMEKDAKFAEEERQERRKARASREKVDIHAHEFI